MYAVLAVVLWESRALFDTSEASALMTKHKPREDGLGLVVFVMGQKQCVDLVVAAGFTQDAKTISSGISLKV